MPIPTATDDSSVPEPRPLPDGALLVAGLGCRKGCSRVEIKANEPGLHALAAHLRLPLALLSATQLAPYDAAVSEHSLRSKALTGSAGLAEASALAQAEIMGNQKTRLLCRKLRSANATCALAITRLP